MAARTDDKLIQKILRQSSLTPAHINQPCFSLLVNTHISSTAQCLWLILTFYSISGSTPNNLKSNSTIWSKFKRKPSEWEGGTPSQPPAPMMGMGGMVGGGAVMRQRFLTLVHGDMETIKLMPNSYAVSPQILHFTSYYLLSILYRKLKQLPESGFDRHPMQASI